MSGKNTDLQWNRSNLMQNSTTLKMNMTNRENESRKMLWLYFRLCNQSIDGAGVKIFLTL